MTDFASILLDPLGVAIDWQVAGGDLASDDGFATAVLISLFTDRLADPDEAVSALAGGASSAAPIDRRGWWADTPVDGSQPVDFIGSKLWLRRRVKLLPSVLAQIEDDIAEALQWMIDDGVAAAVTTRSMLGPARGSAFFPFAIARVLAGGGTVNQAYNMGWAETAGVVSLT